jgi:hypothetical protein
MKAEEWISKVRLILKKFNEKYQNISVLVEDENKKKIEKKIDFGFYLDGGASLNFLFFIFELFILFFKKLHYLIQKLQF